jgi:transcriptional regulator with XRE-family HTH domain
MQIMAGTGDSAVDLSELAGLLQAHRASVGKSLREVAAETGVPYSTLSRVENGQIPDLNTFRNIVAWLGVPVERFFPTARRRQESTPEVVAQALRGDPTLSAQARQQLVSVFEQMYGALTAAQQLVTLHLRADRAYAPEAGTLLSGLLQEMEAKLLKNTSDAQRL